MRADHPIHSTYSDGCFPWQMCGAAEDAGLEAGGVAAVAEALAGLSEWRS